LRLEPRPRVRIGEGLPRIGEGSLNRAPWRPHVPAEDHGVEPAREQPAGFALRQFEPRGVIQFRKIEIKELPPAN
jgi:hypothetical protein